MTIIRGPVPYRVLDAGHHALLPPFLDDLEFVDQETQVVVRVVIKERIYEKRV